MHCLKFEGAPSVPGLLRRLDSQSGRFALENVPAGTAIVGASPQFVLTAKDGAAFISSGSRPDRIDGDPFEILREQLAGFRADDIAPGVPFAGGAIGYFSYDLGRSIERIDSLAVEDVSTPDYALGFYDSALCIDAANRRCVAVSRSGDREALRFWREVAAESSELRCDDSPRMRSIGKVSSSFSKEGYLKVIERVQDYIRAGDVYQVNLAQRFETELACSPLELYGALREVNPSPNACYMEIAGPVLVSASPELFLRYNPRTRRVVTKPIKGTRPRGSSTLEDDRLASELAASEKDRAENLMIVDMLRNDLGRTAEYGSVQVKKLWDIETHPTVFQMVSTVEATVGRSHDAVDIIKTCFPGGSITGAPKIRSMQIIEELEPVRRGIYTGSAGYIDCRGYIDLNIVIRSFVIQESRAYFHGGGGIVIDSDAESEYQETLDKVAGLMAALAAPGE